MTKIEYSRPLRRSAGPSPRAVRRAAMTAMLVAGLSSVPARAGNIWDGGGINANWSTATNWDGDTLPNFANTLRFAGGLNLTPNNDIATTLATLQFDSGAGAFTLIGNPIALNGGVNNNSNVNQTVNFNIDLGAVNRIFSSNNIAGGGLTFGGNITGAGSITLAAPSNITSSLYSPVTFVTLTGTASTYSGNTQVNQGGALAIGSNSALGAGTLVINNGSTVVKAIGGARAITNLVTFTGGFIAGSDDLTFSNLVANSAAANSALNITNTGTTTFAGGLNLRNATDATGRTVTLGGTSQNVFISGVVANGGTTNTAGLSIGQLGLGTAVTMNGAAVNTYTGTTSVNYRSSLTLDYVSLATPTNLINAASNLALNGGTLNIKGQSGTTTAQTFASTAFTASTASAIRVNQNGATAVNLTLGGLTRNASSTLDLTLPTAGSVTTTTLTATGTNNVNGNGVAYATVDGTTWLTNTAGTLGALAGGSYQVDVFTDPSGDTDVQTSIAPVGAVTANTLRFNTASKTLTLDAGTSQITAGGILVTSAGTGSVINGAAGAALQPGATGNQILIHNYGSLDLAVPVVNNGAAVASVVHAGTGVGTLSAANTYTGTTVVTGGTLNISATASLGAGALTVSQGTLAIAGTTTSTAATIQGGGTLLLANTGALATTALVGLNSGGTLALRGDADTTYTIANLGNAPTAGNNMGTANAVYTIDVNSANGSASDKTLTLVTNNGINFSNAAGSNVLNITGGSGYTFAAGPVFLGNANSNPVFTFNVAAGLTFRVGAGAAGQSFSNNGQQTNVEFDGAGTTLLTGNFTEVVNSGRVFNVSRNGTGTLTLQGLTTADTAGTLGAAITGGIFNFYLNSGRVNVNNAGALKAIAGVNTTLFFLGGSIDNTSGTGITLTQPLNATNVFTDFTFGGSNALNMSTGAVTLGGSGTSRTITTNGAGTLTLGGVIGHALTATYGLTKAGPGNLTLTGVNTYSGSTNVTGGSLVLDNGGSVANGNISISAGSLAGGANGTNGTINFRVANDTADLISLSGTGVLDLTSLRFTLLASGTQTFGEYVIANQPVGSAFVLGSNFLSENLPAGWSIDYDGTASNPNNIVALVPEPASLGVVGLIGAALTVRRRTRHVRAA